MRIRQQHLEAFRAPLRAGTPERVLQDLRAGGIPAELDSVSRSITASDSRGAATRLFFRADGLPDALVQPSGSTYHFEHDPEGLLTAIVHPGGERLEIGYDADANVSRLSRPGLCRYDFAYAAGERLTAVRFPDGHQTGLAYDDDGQLTAVTDRVGAITRYHRRDGRLHSIEDPLGRHTVYETDEAGALSAVRFADGSRQEYGYDPEVRVAEITARDGAAIIQELDDSGVIRAVRWADGSFGEFDFDDNGNLISARTEAREVRHTFSGAGDPLTEETDAGLVQYRYDGDRRLVELTTPDGDKLSYEYDPDGRISIVRDWEGRENRFVYAANGTLAEIRYGNGLVERQRYARLGRMAEAEVRTAAGQTISMQRYEYDVCERLTCVAEVQGPHQHVRRFSYDAESRIIEDFDDAAGQAIGRYRYDRKGNLIGDGGKQIEIGLLDEPIRYGFRRIQYDALGNARTMPASVGQIECSFRANGFLAEIHVADRTWRYEYDAFCRRVLKTDGITTWRFGWAGHQLLWEEYEGYPGAAAVRRDYLFVPETVTPLAFRENGRTYWLQNDARGAVIRAFDVDGTVVWSATYDSFGRATEAVSHIRQPWRLLGQYHDTESGLHYNFARYYNPATRSYLSRDPLWFKPEATNYSYARNDPWNRADPFASIPLLLVAVAAVGIQIIAGAAIGAGVALATGGNPVAGAVEGGLTGLGAGLGMIAGAAIGFATGGPPGMVAGAAGGQAAGAYVGSIAGAFAGSVAENLIAGEAICWPCALGASGVAAVFPKVLRSIVKLPGVNRLAKAAGQRLAQAGRGVSSWAKKKLSATITGAKKLASKAILRGRVYHALLSSDPTKRLEAKVARSVMKDLRVFDKKFGPNGSIGQIDVETSKAIIEVTTRESGKMKQLRNFKTSTTMNPSGKPVILFAPKYRGTPANSAAKEGFIVVRNVTELRAALANIK